MDHSLQIGKIACECRLPRDLSIRASSGERVNEIARRHLPLALAGLLEPLCADTDESIWMIRRLDIAFSADLSWDETKLAGCWAAALARSLVKSMHGPRDGRSVYHYSSPVEYTAAFMTDLAEGVAWNKWQYESFSGLRVLDSSAGLRTLLVTRTGTALPALMALTAGSLHRVLTALLAHDARTVWSHLTALSLPAGPSVIEHVLRIWEAGGFRHHPSQTANALRLLVRTLSQARDVSLWREAVSVADALLALDTLHAQTPPEQWSNITAAFFSAQLAASSHTRCDWTAHPELLQRAIDRLAGNPASTTTQAETRMTPFGAVFLLLPLIDAVPAEIWSDQPELLRFAIFVRCCSPDTRAAARRDSLLRDLFNLTPDSEIEDLELRVTPEDIWHWMGQLAHIATGMPLDTLYLGNPDAVAIAAHSVLRAFAWKLPGFGSSSLSHLWINFLDFRASLELSSDRIVVRMARPPLHVILSLAGLSRGSYSLPRIDPRPFHLFPEA